MIINHHNYKNNLNIEAINIIINKVNNLLLDKFKNYNIQYNILNKLLNPYILQLIHLLNLQLLFLKLNYNIIITFNI